MQSGPTLFLEHIQGYCIVCCPALNRQTCEHILEFMGEQGVTDVCRISVLRDGAKKPTNTFVFTFNSPVLPSVVK